MIDVLIIDNAKYTGEVGNDGLPDGRGCLSFADGRVFSGEIHYSIQRGSGVWRYPDGSSLYGGFTLCRDMPAWKYCDAQGRITYGAVYRTVSENGENDDLAADEACLMLCTKLRALGMSVEFNARALLVDAIMRDALTVDEAVMKLQINNERFVTVPEVMAIM